MIASVLDARGDGQTYLPAAQMPDSLPTGFLPHPLRRPAIFDTKLGMQSAPLQPKIVRMPTLADGEWLNTAVSHTHASLKGQVVLIDFWDYTCINCLRTLPYLVEWHRRYAKHGLQIIGIHAPEFKFAQTKTHIQAAIDRFGLPYPVLLDNDYANWSRFANKAWPTKYLVDAEGYIRYQRQGEGYYQETERVIQRLLRQHNPAVDLPELLPPLRPEDAAGAVCYRPTPEIYAGYQGGGLFGGGLGNLSGYVPDRPIFYDLPEERENGRFYLSGVWRAWPEAVAYAGQDGGKLVVSYTAVSINAVLTPSADPVELALNLRPTTATPFVTVEQDGRFLDPLIAGQDVQIGENGRSVLHIDQPRMVELVKNPTYGSHELTLTFHATGLAVYAFSFTSCVTTTPNASTDTYRVG